MKIEDKMPSEINLKNSVVEYNGWMIEMRYLTPVVVFVDLRNKSGNISRLPFLHLPIFLYLFLKIHF